MDAQSTFQEKVAAAEETHRLRIIQARALLTSEEIRAQAEYYRTFETVGWYRNAFKVYRAAMAFAESSYDQAVVGSVRMKYTEIVAAWVECRVAHRYEASPVGSVPRVLSGWNIPLANPALGQTAAPERDRPDARLHQLAKEFRDLLERDNHRVRQI